MNIEFSKQAVKTIERMDRITRKRIGKGIAELPNGDIKPLVGCEGTYRLRIADCGILFFWRDRNIMGTSKNFSF